MFSMVKLLSGKKIDSVAPQEFVSGRLFGFNLDQQSTLCKNVNM